MIEYKGYKADRAYFAAANGYSGFRSYFDTLFIPQEFDRIFILKGGPGTGKSTILKGLALHANQRGYSLEAVHCSSDPSSLDGVIISSHGRRVAVIDGTAPHERDTILPGVFDEIINLGDGFDIEALTARRDEIYELYNMKKNAYVTAYSHLGTAGAIFKDAYIEFCNSKCYKEAENEALRLSESIQASDSEQPKRIITSSFGALGYSALDERCVPKKRVMRILGDGVSEYAIINCLCTILGEKHAISELHPSPLSDKIPDGIVTDNIAFFIDHTPSSSRAHCSAATTSLSELLYAHTAILRLAAAEFKKASEYHFALECIYSKHTDFKNNDRIFLEICAKVDSLLRA